MNVTVYIFHAPEVNRVKIGLTYKTPEKRLAYVQATCPVPLILIGHAPGDYRTESLLHEINERFRTHNEWFQDEVLQEIAKHISFEAYVLHVEQTLGREKQPKYLHPIKKRTPSRKIVCGMQTMYARGCRCDLCKTAAAKFARDFKVNNPESHKRSLKKYLEKILSTAPHNPGKQAWYQAGCRCDGCREVSNEAKRDYLRRNPR